MNPCYYGVDSVEALTLGRGILDGEFLCWHGSEGCGECLMQSGSPRELSVSTVLCTGRIHTPQKKFRRHEDYTHTDTRTHREVHITECSHAKLNLHSVNIPHFCCPPTDAFTTADSFADLPGCAADSLLSRSNITYFFSLFSLLRFRFLTPHTEE